MLEKEMELFSGQKNIQRYKGEDALKGESGALERS